MAINPTVKAYWEGRDWVIWRRDDNLVVSFDKCRALYFLPGIAFMELIS